jgi:Tfp pilus assembly protein PilN
MIQINLLPEELRTAVKAKAAFPVFKPEAKYLFYLPALLLAVFAACHLILAVWQIARNFQYAALERKWKQMEPQRKQLEAFNQEYSLSLQNTREIQQLAGQSAAWAQKLNRLSADLPSGVWFNELGVSQKELTLNCSVVSLQKDEMGAIQRFIDILKGDAAFIKDFAGLELGSVQKKVLGSYDIVDFTLTCPLKGK